MGEAQFLFLATIEWFRLEDKNEGRKGMLPSLSDYLPTHAHYARRLQSGGQLGGCGAVRVGRFDVVTEFVRFVYRPLRTCFSRRSRWVTLFLLCLGN